MYETERYGEKYQKVVLYYPNNWKRFIGDVAPVSEKQFNWFLCSRRYKDPKTGYFVAEIGRGTKFYEESTGKTLVVPLVDDENGKKEEKIRLWIVENTPPEITEIEKLGYQGYATLRKCDLGSKASDEFVICKEAEFFFLPGVLSESQKERFCPIIEFSKRNNKCIKAKLSDFPSSKEIDDVLENYKCSTVCRVLYEYIYLYLSKL